MNLIFLIISIQLCFSFKIKQENESEVAKQEDEDGCGKLQKRECLATPHCGWCRTKFKCVYSNDSQSQYCIQIDTYIFDNEEEQYDPFSYNNNVEYDTKQNELKVSGLLGKTILKQGEDKGIPGFYVKKLRKLN